MRKMVTLFVHFQEGFKDDTIVLWVNGKEVFHKEHITTKGVLGRADECNVKVKSGQVNIEAIIPQKEITKTITLKVLSNTYLGISIVDGIIEFTRPQVKPFSYQ
jgi:hypothetical protein